MMKQNWSNRRNKELNNGIFFESLFCVVVFVFIQYQICFVIFFIKRY